MPMLETMAEIGYASYSWRSNGQGMIFLIEKKNL